MKLAIGEPACCNLVTPEGVGLSFEVAQLGDRLAAFLIDIFLIAAGSVALLLLAVLAFGAGGEVAVAFALVAGFLLRQFYFVFFELRGSGVTPGKQRLGLRVISRDGGPLTADRIFARNLMRDLEFFLPVIALMAPEVLFPQRGAAALAGMLWLFVFALLPLFGQYRLRCGDLLAGTIVVREPRAALLPDLALDRGEAEQAAAETIEEYALTSDQLEVYGIHELQVLEDLFRRRQEGRASQQLLDDVAGRIQKKIGWTAREGSADTLRFLRAFYTAQRRHLEQKMLLGDRKERKGPRPH